MSYKLEISFYKKIFKSGYCIDNTKSFGHLWTFGFQFLCFTGFLKFYK